MSIVQSRPESTRHGGVTGKGFTPGVSGNPGGRPKGLSRRVRELVGDDGQAIAEFMLSVMEDDRARTADRIEAGKWLADRGFGKAVLVVSPGVTPEDLLRDYFSKLSLEDWRRFRRSWRSTRGTEPRWPRPGGVSSRSRLGQSPLHAGDRGIRTVLRTDALELHVTSIEVVDTLTLDEWIAAVRILNPRASSCPWWMGDLMSFGQNHFDVSEDRFGLLSAETPFAESGPIMRAIAGTLVPSEHEGASDLVEPASGELLIESRGKRAVLLDNGRILLTTT